jgi:hypothetical protein
MVLVRVKSDWYPGTPAMRELNAGLVSRILAPSPALTISSVRSSNRMGLAPAAFQARTRVAEVNGWLPERTRNWTAWALVLPLMPPISSSIWMR